MGLLNSRCARCNLGSASGGERLHPVTGNKPNQNKLSFSWLAAGGEGSRVLEPSQTLGLPYGMGGEQLCPPLSPWKCLSRGRKL